MTKQYTETKTSPDELMEHFQGRSLKSIIFFTLAVHAVVILGTSVPFMVNTLKGADTSKMSEEERIESAVRKATAKLREIAEDHGLKPQDLSSRFAGGAPRMSAAQSGRPGEPEPEPEPAVDTPETEEPKSAIEKELEVKAKGPALPSMEDEDLFK